MLPAPRSHSNSALAGRHSGTSLIHFPRRPRNSVHPSSPFQNPRLSVTRGSGTTLHRPYLLAFRPVMPVSMVPVSPPPSALFTRPYRSSSLSKVYPPSTHEVHPKVIPASSTPQTPMASLSDSEDHSHPSLPTMHGKDEKGHTDDVRTTSRSRPKNGRRTLGTDTYEIPAEYKVEVDKVFLEFLGNICSNRGCPFYNTARVHTNR